MKTKLISFSIQQVATVTWTATASVPESLDLDDVEAVADWLEKNRDTITYPDQSDQTDYDDMDFGSVEGIDEIPQ